MNKKMDFTGERYVPELGGEIKLEHLHRYLMAMDVAKNKVVLDIASGEGYGSSILSEVAKKVYGVDISEASVEHARSRYKNKNIDFIVGSCENIPLPDSSVDIVVSFETLEHHDKHIEMFREIKRVLSPSGSLIISTPDKYNYTVYPNFNNEHHVKELFEKDFRSLLEANFKYSHFYRQRVMYGSAIISEKIQTNFLNFLDDGETIKKESNLIEPIYWIAYVSDSEITPPAYGFYESKNAVTNQLNEIEELRLKVRQIEISSFKTQFQLSRQVYQKDLIITKKDQELSLKDQNLASKEQDIIYKDEIINALKNSRSMLITAPLRVILRFIRLVISALKLIKLTIKRGGGFWRTLFKAFNILRLHGFKGVKCSLHKFDNIKNISE